MDCDLVMTLARKSKKSLPDPSKGIPVTDEFKQKRKDAKLSLSKNMRIERKKEEKLIKEKIESKKDTGEVPSTTKGTPSVTAPLPSSPLKPSPTTQKAHTPVWRVMENSELLKDSSLGTEFVENSIPSKSLDPLRDLDDGQFNTAICHYFTCSSVAQAALFERYQAKCKKADESLRQTIKATKKARATEEANSALVFENNALKEEVKMLKDNLSIKSSRIEELEKFELELNHMIIDKENQIKDLRTNMTLAGVAGSLVGRRYELEARNASAEELDSVDVSVELSEKLAKELDVYIDHFKRMAEDADEEDAHEESPKGTPEVQEKEKTPPPLEVSTKEMPKDADLEKALVEAGLVTSQPTPEQLKEVVAAPERVKKNSQAPPPKPTKSSSQQAPSKVPKPSQQGPPSKRSKTSQQ